MPHNHKRKPKAKVEGPPGLSRASDGGDWEEPVAHIRSLVQQCSDQIDEVVRRVQAIEALLLGSNFADFERLDVFVKEFFKAPSRCTRYDNGCRFFDIHSDADGNEERDTFVDICSDVDQTECCMNAPESYDDVFTLLANSVIERASDISFVSSIIDIYPTQCTDEIMSQGQSLLMKQLSKQCTSHNAVSLAKASCRAFDMIGKTGRMPDLMANNAITVGSILESASYGDHVFIRGFNGIRYTTATPVIRIKEIDESMPTVCDGSECPTLDRGGRIAFGRID